jgi:antitoxin component YwqK of YwqJK toxin-antitoxin module
MMRKYSIFFFLAIISFSLYSQKIDCNDLTINDKGFPLLHYYKGKLFSGQCVTYHSNGKVNTETSFLEGKFHGYSKIWTEDGFLYSSKESKNGCFCGKNILYYYNSNQVYWLRNAIGCAVPHGKQARWLKDGDLLEEIYFENGKKVGNWRQWYVDKQLMFDINYKNDQLNGRCCFYTEYGNSYCGEYNNGILIEGDNIQEYIEDNGGYNWD